jgi:hypothetical protein
MSFLTSVKNFFVSASTDVDKASKVIYAKADADVADLKKHVAVSKQAQDVATKVAGAHALVADYVKLLNEQPVVVSATGPTGPAPSA